MLSRLINRVSEHRSVDAMEIPPVGWRAHREGVDRLLRSFRAVPQDLSLIHI